MSVTIQITDTATPEITRLQELLASPALRAVIGRSGRNHVRDHLFKLDAARHRPYVRLHFYARAARATNYRVLPDGAAVSINHLGIAQRYFGGEIRPRNSKYLTIPARSEAEGRRAREFNNLKPVFGRNGIYALAERSATRLRKTGKGYKSAGETGGGIMFWLVKSVTQHEDPSVLPKMSKLVEAVVADAEKYIDKIENQQSKI